jgi:hypothetical protein
VLACDLTAINEAERPRYESLCTRLQDAIMERRELSDGYAFRLDSELMSLMDAAQWISLERLCCPFLTFQLQATGSERDYWLWLQGPPEAKAIVDDAFRPATKSPDGI